MNHPLQVGVTGGIGSGKSWICRIFACLGAPVYDADSHARTLMTTDLVLMDHIRSAFGDLSYSSDGVLNRSFLAETVFGHASQREVLNAIVHPRVALDYSDWVKAHRASPYVIKEAALLVESGSANALDVLIVVAAPAALRLKRVLARDPHRDAAAVTRIMDSQLPEHEKMELADNIIHNDESSLVVPQVLELHERFIARVKSEPESFL